MAQPTTIQELVYNDTSTVDSTRTTQGSPGICYWTPRNLPAAGKAALDSTVGGNNCEVVKFEFSGHGANNYVTNFKYYINNRNAVAQDMTHFFKATDTWVAPNTYSDADIYGFTGDWSHAEVSVPASPNVATDTSYAAYADPTRTQFIYNSVIVEAAKTTGTATWSNVLMYQYT